MRVLHVASFNGNIGDIANHSGFRRELTRRIPDVEFDNLEIRYFYQSWNKCKFDKEFAELANKYDLLIIGGGGFFELKWDYSVTGTTVDISEEVLEAVKIPILFNCIGTSIAKGTSQQAIEKFDSFLESVLKRGHFVSVRNDGSWQLLNQLYHDKYREQIWKVPDGGFFCRPKEYEQPLVVSGYKNIAINIAGDMPEIRFPGNGKIKRADFIKEMAVFCNHILTKDEHVRLIFVPHIASDIRIISEVMEEIKDINLRLRVTCAGCYNGEATDGLINFDLYRKCDLVIGMRYHANVVPIGMNVPTIMLGSYAPHIALYKDIGISHRCVLANEAGFSEILEKKVLHISEDSSWVFAENMEILNKLQKENNDYMIAVKKWLEAKKRGY